MPLQDRAEFRAWLARREAEDRKTGRGGPADECAHCGATANEQELHGESCIVCASGPAFGSRPEPPPTLVTPEGGGERVSTFHEYASWWLQAKVDGVLGKKPLSESTATDYRWRLRCHLLPFFAKYRLDQIDRELCLAFKAQKLREAKELRDALDAGADMRDRLGRRAVPLSPASMRKLLDCLAGILDEAVEDGHIESNPARGRRMRVHVPKPSRTFLEMDELAALIDAAGDHDVQLGPSAPISEAVGPTAALVAHLLAQGKRSSQIAAELGIAPRSS